MNMNNVLKRNVHPELVEGRKHHSYSWKKVGRIINPEDFPCAWMASHASVPFAWPVGGDRFAIYFSTRNADNRAQGGYVIIDINNPFIILETSEEPVLTLGELGCFDDSGAWPSWLVEHQGRLWMYYIGWNAGVRVPFYNNIGLAMSDNGGKTFSRVSRAPLLERTDQEPFLTASSCVLREHDRWRMWYLSCVGWRVIDGKPQHCYHIKYAESFDGISWQREGHVALDFSSPDEYAIARPCVVKDANGGYTMWYCYRGGSATYRLGVAWSLDGLSWQRHDAKVGIDVSAEGWDSQMICYPYVFTHKERTYLLYNGNAYGKTGIGLAVLQ